MVEDLLFIEDVVKLPLVDLPNRCTVVKTSKGVVVVSTTSNLNEHQEEIEALGPVVAVVAPNLFHSLFLRRTLKLFPQARLWGPEGLEKKTRGLAPQHLLGRDPWPFETELAMIPIHGMPRFREFVFFHSSSRSLIVTDLCFNLAAGSRPLERIFLSLAGTNNRLAISRLFKLFVKNKSQFAESLQAVLQLDFDRIVMAHGRILEENSKERLRAILKERALLIADTRS